jgi:hypothetical protein
MPDLNFALALRPTHKPTVALVEEVSLTPDATCVLGLSVSLLVVYPKYSLVHEALACSCRSALMNIVGAAMDVQR